MIINHKPTFSLMDDPPELHTLNKKLRCSTHHIYIHIAYKIDMNRTPFPEKGDQPEADPTKI